MKARRFIMGAITLFGSILSAGCIDHDNAPTYRWTPPGIVKMSWSIEGETQAQACEKHNATDVQFLVYTQTGLDFTTIQVPCDLFGVNIWLPDDTYRVGAWLIDVQGEPVSAIIYREGVPVHEDQEIPLTIDFGSESLL